MNPSLETNPRLGVLAMDELLDVMEFHSDEDALRRVIRDAEQYLKHFSPDENDYDRKTWELRWKMMQAFLKFVRYQHEDDISPCKKRLLFTDQESTPTRDWQSASIKHCHYILFFTIWYLDCTRDRTMPSAIRTHPWSAGCELICMLYDLRTEATAGDLDKNLNTMKELAGIRDAPTPEIKQAQTEMFDAFWNYLKLIKASAKPLAVTKDLEEYPACACVALDEIMSAVDERAKADHMEKVKTRINHYVLEAPSDACEDQKKFNKFYNGVMLASLDFICYREDRPPPRDRSDYSTSYEEPDRWLTFPLLQQNPI